MGSETPKGPANEIREKVAHAGEAIRGVLGDELFGVLCQGVRQAAEGRMRKFAATPIAQSMAREMRANPGAPLEETIVVAFRELIKDRLNE